MKHTLSLNSCVACGGTSCELPYKLQVDGLLLDEFFAVHGDWSQKTFGTDKERGPLGPLKHIAKELLSELLPFPRETVAAMLATVPPDFVPPRDIEELADLLFLLFDVTRRSGFTFEQLRIAVNQKMRKNQARSWPRIGNINDAVEHDRSGERRHGERDDSAPAFVDGGQRIVPEGSGG